MTENIDICLIYREADGLIINATVGCPPLREGYASVLRDEVGAAIGDRLAFDEEGVVTVIPAGTSAGMIDFPALQQDAVEFA